MIRPIAIGVLALCLAGCDAVTNSPRPLAKSATLEIFAVSNSPTPGAKETIDPATNSPLFLTTPAIISATDVATIQRAENSPEDLSILVKLTPAGAKKLAAATAKPADMQVAIVANGKLVSAPRVRVPISTAFQVSGGVISKDREKIFAALTEE